ncbi:sodium channel protein Nach [Anabrus simplex]|uniref:sodium channel protein Nach n=1 Tax=Anabrus simplex TaxID=316456 RepID=UPI0035A2EF74
MPNPTQARTQQDDGLRWTQVLWSVVEEYMENTSLHGYRYLTEPNRHWLERLLWLIIHGLAAWGVVNIILGVWEEFVNTPTVTTVDSTNYPIWNVPFPAVAVCNINRISKSRARETAKKVSTERTEEDEERLFQLLRYLGRLYDHDDDDKGKLEELHVMLTTLNSSYDVNQLMKDLSPQCSELLVRCMWLGRVYDCEELFDFRKTMDGYCCTFNYIRQSDSFGDYGKTHNQDDPEDIVDDGVRVNSPGYQMGLSVVLNPEPEDYYYPLISSIGTKILVYNPRDFPDTPSGGLIEKLVPLRSEVFYRIEATTVESMPDVQEFALDQRGCLFQSELSEEFSGYYSYSDCLMNCRVKSINTLCKCVPFYMPKTSNIRDCDLLDIPCLNRYREKWTTLRPPDNVPGLDVEREESITCHQCLPACSDSAYHVQTTSAPLTNEKYGHSLLSEDLQFGNHSVFHLFFGSVNSVKLKQDILYYWYELLSNFGGICGLFVGFSLISVVEFVYFFTFRLFFATQRGSHSEEQPTTESSTGERSNFPNGQKGELYWKEFQAPRF